jgi:glycosyltransferase involved in cell wall biosynthesis
MKLAFVVKTLDSRGGGAERVLTQVTSVLAARGHELTLISMGTEGEPDFYAVDPEIRRIWLGAGRPQERSGVRDVAQRVLALRRAIGPLKPDVAVGFMHSAYVPLALALAMSRTPVVASEHIVYDHYKSFPLEARALRLTAPLYSRMTIISEAVRRSFPTGLERKMVVIPNPVATTNSRADPVGGVRKVVLNIGRLTEQKDQQTLIKAFGQVAARHPDWILRIVGEGALRGRLEALVDELGLGARVQLPGVIEDIEDEYASAQLFAMPSLYESFGMATAEALAAGVPAIGFRDCPGTNELIEHDVNGWLVDATDRVTALADALDRMMNSPDLRRRMGASAPASVERFAPEVIADQWEILLRDAAERRGGKAA